jgi:hypothetical protein
VYSARGPKNYVRNPFTALLMNDEKLSTIQEDLADQLLHQGKHEPAHPSN